MRSLILVVALSTILVSCQKNTPTITGTLLGADGEPMPSAHERRVRTLKEDGCHLSNPNLAEDRWAGFRRTAYRVNYRCNAAPGVTEWIIYAYGLKHTQNSRAFHV